MNYVLNDIASSAIDYLKDKCYSIQIQIDSFNIKSNTLDDNRIDFKFKDFENYISLYLFENNNYDISISSNVDGYRCCEIEFDNTGCLIDDLNIAINLIKNKI